MTPSPNPDTEALIWRVAEAIYQDQVHREGFAPQLYSAADWYHEARVAVETIFAPIGKVEAAQ